MRLKDSSLEPILNNGSHYIQEISIITTTYLDS
jgi:hypothetical protein